MTDYYNLLDLDKNASIDALKKAYKQKSIKMSS
jgi:DnaJ-class molecular chaperone